MRNARCVGRPLAVVFLLVLCHPPGTAYAGDVAYRVEDLRTIPYGGSYQLDATEVASAGAHAFFAGDDGVHGTELWISDGTVAGSRIVADLATASFDSDPRGLLRAGPDLYFTACSPVSGCEPWRTDGTAEGTAQLLDVWPGPRSSDAWPIAVVAGRLFFAAADPEHGTELWVSDGTSAGTRLVEDLNPGPESSLESCYVEGELAGGLGLGGRLYFTAYDPLHGCELWSSDGTPAGTYLLKSLIPGWRGGDPTAFRRVGSRLLFTGEDSAHGRELWTTDGSGQGTQLVRDLVPGPAGSWPVPLGAIGDRLLFAAGAAYDPDLWLSDGTSSGTLLVRTFSTPGEELRTSASEIGGRVVFCARDPAHGLEPWTTDGTAAGTTLLADLTPGEWGSGACPRGVGREGAYLVGYDGGPAIWRTNGTPSGTHFAGSIAVPGQELPFTKVAAAGSGTLVLACDSDLLPLNCRIWRTDGTPPGTQRLFPESGETTASNPRHLTARVGGIVLEAFLDVPSQEIVRSDGTEEGTYTMMVPTSTRPSLDDRALLPSGELVLAARSLDGSEPWRTDGDTFVQVVDLEPGGGWSSPRGFQRIGDVVYFAAGGFDASGVWTTDGTGAGTTRVTEQAQPYSILGAFGRAWFGAEATLDGQYLGEELWESSGTAATTFPHDLVPGPASSDPWFLTAVESAGGAIAFFGDGPSCQDDAIYQYDLATGEAHVVRVIDPYASSYYGPPPIAGLRGRLLFFDLASDGICALFSSDGSAGDATRIKHVGSGFAESYYSIGGCPTRAVEHDDALYFTACGPLAGCELWRSDGTTAGTNRVVDLVPGPGSSFPSHLTSIGDRLYLEACTPQHGCEPWVTDGSAAGLHRLADIAAGAASSSSAEFTLSERLVYFAADDGTGAELWAMPLEIFYDGFATGDRSRWSSSTP